MSTTDPIHDLVIVGAGPAGLTAAVFSVNNGIDTILLEGAVPGGQLAALYPKKPVYNYPGTSGVPAEELAARMIDQCVSAGVTPITDSGVLGIDRNNDCSHVHTGEITYSARCVILACGMGLFRPRRLGVNGEDEVKEGRLAYAIADPEEWSGLTVAVLGGGDSAADNALLLYESGAKVTLIHRRDALKAQQSTIRSIQSCDISTMLGWNVDEVSFTDDGLQLKLMDSTARERRVLEFDRVLVNIGVSANTAFLDSLPVQRKKSRILVDTEMRTSIPGVFACGDIVEYPGKTKLIVTAVGEAATAVAGVTKYLKGRPQSDDDERRPT